MRRARRIGVLYQSSEKQYVPMIEALARKTRFETVGLVADTAEEIAPARRRSGLRATRVIE